MNCKECITGLAAKRGDRLPVFKKQYALVQKHQAESQCNKNARECADVLPQQSRRSGKNQVSDRGKALRLRRCQQQGYSIRL